MSTDLIARYSAGSAVLSCSVAGLAPADLDAFPIPGTWSIRQIVVHTLDSDLIATHRLRRIVAEELPLLVSYDETLFAKTLRYEDVDMALALRLFTDNRAFTTLLLNHLPEPAWARVGIHSQRGKITVADIVRMYADHVDHHVGFIIKKRALLGKPLPG
ncbi:MAG: DinB family protein [Phycisphaerales bacterium]